MWMGTHSGAPSRVCSDNEKKLINLADVCGGHLPFLFKLIAAGKPLSIQAHPNLAQAVEGFKREEVLKIPLDAPNRNYKDPNHKPEILCAITPFTVMAGFRTNEEIKSFFEAFMRASPFLKETFSSLLRALDAPSLVGFFRALFQLTERERKNICSFLLEKETCESIPKELWKLMGSFASQYPQDAAVISPLYLNVFTLERGEAVFVPAGVLHAYISGFGVELMASSDNVLRGGLTPKHVDIGELMNILDFNPFMPPVFPPSCESFFRYPAPCNDFSLFFIRGNGDEKTFPVKGPAICIVTEGELHSGDSVFKKGESFFIPCDKSPPVFGGNYSLFAASSAV
jgi:mannose-6-phosphate isomerase